MYQINNLKILKYYIRALRWETNAPKNKINNENTKDRHETPNVHQK